MLQMGGQTTQPQHYWRLWPLALLSTHHTCCTLCTDSTTQSRLSTFNSGGSGGIQYIMGQIKDLIFYIIFALYMVWDTLLKPF